MLRMSCDASVSWMRACIAWITEPAPRNRQALKKACVKTWKKPAANAPHADAEEHEAELAHRGVGEHLLDVVLDERDRRREERGQRADERDHRHRRRATARTRGESAAAPGRRPR